MQTLIRRNKDEQRSPLRHSREGGNPVCNLLLRNMFKDWIPAFAGMTVLLGSTFTPLFSALQTPEDRILAKGFSAYMDGRDKQALSYFEEVIRINPKNNAARRGLDKVKVRLRRADDEAKAKALSLSKSRYKEGRGLEKTGDLVGAIDSYHASVDATPTYKPSKEALSSIQRHMKRISNKRSLNLSSFAYARGVLAYLDRDWAKAYRIWSERSQLDPANVALANATARAENNFKRMMITEQEDFYRRGARAFYGQGLYRQSKDSWSKVLALRDGDQEALEGTARAEEAILNAEGKGRSNEIHDLLEQGLEAYAEQDWRKALPIFQHLAALDPNFTTAQEYIGKINQQIKTSDYSPIKESIDTLFRRTRASNQGEDSVKVPDKLENFADSKRELESQLKRDPSNINVQRELDRVTKSQDEESERIYKEGLIAYSQGNRTMAIQQWKQVLVINPDHKKALAALKKARAEEERTAEPSTDKQ